MATIINGSPDSDQLEGTAGDDIISGFAGSDVLSGLAGNDTIDGGSGDDYLYGGIGDDSLDGGDGLLDVAVYYDASSGVSVDLSIFGAQAIGGGQGTDVLVNIEALIGSAYDDTLSGNSADNYFIALSGNDIVNGGAGRDHVIFDVAGSNLVTEGVTVDLRISGFQFISNDAGLDSLTSIEDVEGTAFNDALIGSSDNNSLSGGNGNDTLTGGAGDDVINGGNDVDTATYSFAITGVTVNLNLEGSQFVSVEQGTDTLFSIESLIGSINADHLIGNAGNNTLSGAQGNDTLNGNGGNDFLDGQRGADSMAGGVGNDTYVVDSSDDTVVENSGAGIDLVRSSVADTILRANVEQLLLTAATAVNGTGNGLNNLITGNSVANTLSGDAGNDTLDGGAGNDTLTGGTGNDVYLVNAASDIVTELLNAGTDTIQSSVSYNLGDTDAAGANGGNVEHLTLLGSAVINGTGNALNNRITGNSAGNSLAGGLGNDTLDGGLGADKLAGGAGNDVYVINVATDAVAELLAEGIDTIQSSVSYNLNDSDGIGSNGGNIEHLTLIGAASINATGNAFNNRIIGNTGNNILNGGAGNDSLTGGAGIDAFVFSNALSATANRDTIVDFAVGSDKLKLDDDIFSQFNAATSVSLASAQFHSGAGVTTAGDSNDRIIYNTTTGALYYDADGTGAAAGIQFAILATRPTLLATDFVIVA